MKLFIDYSGARGLALAEKIQWFVGLLIQSAEPWISTDIARR